MTAAGLEDDGEGTVEDFMDYCLALQQLLGQMDISLSAKMVLGTLIQNEPSRQQWRRYYQRGMSPA